MRSLSSFALSCAAVVALSAAAPGSAAVDDDDAPPPRLIQLIESVERWRVPRGARVDVDALGRTVRVRGAAGSEVRSAVCPRSSVDNGALVLGCMSRRIGARVVDNGAGALLELITYKGPPLRDGDGTMPLLTFEPSDLSIGGTCPGDTPAAQGECALRDRDLKRAVRSFRTAMTKGQREYAALRLGDVAMLNGDVARAASFYDRAGPIGMYARLAAARLCLMLGTCFTRDSSITFEPLDPGGLPPPLADEIVLRRAHALAYHDRLEEAVAALLSTTTAERSPCRRAPALCRRIVLEAMRATVDDPAPHPATLALYLALPERAGTGASELARRASDEARKLGAARFAADLRAWSLQKGAIVESELMRTAELYLDAEDPVHAAAILTFARAQIPRLKYAARWREIERQVEALLGAPLDDTRATPARPVAKPDQKSDAKPDAKPDPKPDPPPDVRHKASPS